MLSRSIHVVSNGKEQLKKKVWTHFPFLIHNVMSKIQGINLSVKNIECHFFLLSEQESLKSTGQE